VKRPLILRRVALAAIALVTAWSLWASAQPKKAPAPAEHSPSSESEGKGEEAEHEAPGAINWTNFGDKTPPFAANLINFGILAAAYYLFGKKPIAAGLQKRRDQIARSIEEAQRLLEEAKADNKTRRARLDKLEEDQRTAREALVRAGEAERDRIIREAEASAERIRRDAEFVIEQELKQIRVDLLRDTVEAAVSTAEDLLKKRVTPADQERLAEDYLSDLGAKAKTAGQGAGTGTQETVS
jgi:F-type H+-transporting ATPase subunit b